MIRCDLKHAGIVEQVCNSLAINMSVIITSLLTCRGGSRGGGHGGQMTPPSARK